MDVASVQREPVENEEDAMDGERWLTVAQTAERVQVHPETVREWLREGKLRGNLINRRAGWRVRESDVERLLSGGLNEGITEGKLAA